MNIHIVKTNVLEYIKNFQSPFRDKYWNYTFWAVFFKCVFFLEFTRQIVQGPLNYLAVIGSVLLKLQYFCGFIIIFMTIAFLMKGRVRFWYLFGYNLLVSVLLLIDLWYYRGFTTVPTLHVLNQTGNLENLSDTILSLIKAADMLLILDFPFILYKVLKYKGKFTFHERQPAAFSILFITSLIVVTYIPITGKDSGTVYKMIDPTIVCQNLSPIGYHVMSTYEFWKDAQPFELSSDQKDKVEKWFQTKAENLPDNQYAGMFKGKNLISIQVESFESFMLNQKADGQEITPNINKLIKNSLLFPNICEQVNEGTSSDADLIINTSVFPLRHGSTFFRNPGTNYNSLPILLGSLGYETTAIHPDKGSFWNWMPALKSMGYKNCIDSTAFTLEQGIGMGLSDASYFKQVEPMITKMKQPFYAFTVTLTSHAPFNLPEKYRELKLNKELDESKLGGYYQSVHYTDKYIGEFVNALDKNGLLDNTVIMIYGDHRGVHKYYTSELEKQPGLQKWESDKTYSVPLIVYSKGSKGQTFDVIGGQVDILPTIAYLMGVDKKKFEYTAMGRPLVNTNRSFAVLRDGEYVGNEKDEKLKANDIEGLDIADMVIRSNYFREYAPK